MADTKKKKPVELVKKADGAVSPKIPVKKERKGRGTSDGYMAK